MDSLHTLVEKAKTQEMQKRMVVVSADDMTVLSSVKKASNDKIILPILIGDKTKIYDISERIRFDIHDFEVIHEPIPEKAALIAVQWVRDHKADLLMKGNISTSSFLHAVVDKDHGIRKHEIMSHLALCEGKNYHKILGITDVAMNIAPTFQEKIRILENAVQTFHSLGVANPKVAVICPIETVNDKIESTVHGAMLTLMNRRKQITGCTIDGPLALDNALSKEAAIHKHIDSEVAGDADLLLVPELNSGNILYKSMTMIGQFITAAIVTGAEVPIVLTSRSDTEESKYRSIALAASL